MATAAVYEEAEDAHLMDREQFMKGGRDTALLVWALLALMVVTFSLLMVAAGDPTQAATGKAESVGQTAAAPAPGAQNAP